MFLIARSPGITEGPTAVSWIPKLVVVAGYRSDYQDLLERRFIDLVIAPRFDALPETARKPKTLREWFDQEYMIIDPQKTSALPR